MVIWRIYPSLRSCPFFLFNNDSFICLSGQNIFRFSGSPSRIFIKSLFIPWRLHSGNKICFFSSSGLCKLIHNRLLIWSLTKFISTTSIRDFRDHLRSLQVPLQCSSFYSLSLSSLFWRFSLFLIMIIRLLICATASLKREFPRLWG